MSDTDDDSKAIKKVFEESKAKKKAKAKAAPKAKNKAAPKVKAKPGGGKKRKGTAGPGGRILLNDIDPRAWEHPADRAALNALRKVPGFDRLLRMLFGAVSERSLRLLFLANSVKVSDRQFTKLHKAYLECCEVLGVDEPPDLFVAQTPIVNAGAIGVDKPFIVLNSGTLALLDEEEQRFVLAHELGHVLSGHALYKTMLRMLLSFSLGRLGIPLAGAAIAAIVMALREWDRKSELSSDRCGLLCVQDPQVAYRVQMKMAGGSQLDQMDPEAFMDQAREYEAAGDVMDGLFKLLNSLSQTHPFPVVRLAELRKWVDGGDYANILAGEYVRRGDDTTTYADVSESIKSYRSDVEASDDPLAKFVRDMSTSLGEGATAMMDQLRDAWTKRRADGDEPDGDEPDDKA